MTWKYIPKTIGVFDRKTGKFHADAPVKTVKLHPPGTHAGSGIRDDMFLAEIITPYGTRKYGFEKGCIDSRLRMAVFRSGEWRDEVLAKWKNAPSAALECGGGKKKRRRKGGR